MIDLARSIVGIFLINMMEQGMLSKILRIVVELVFLILIGDNDFNENPLDLYGIDKID